MAVRGKLLLPWQLASIWAATQLPFFFVEATTSSPTFNLSSEILDFIPSCAQSCFKSFVEVNYDTNQCGSSPSLQCLCSLTGSQGFTIGEGAVQCIVAEDNVGECTGMDAASQVLADGYNMCNSQVGAASKTHATIIATLIIPPSGPVIVPEPGTTTVTTSTTVSLSSSYMMPSITMTTSSSPNSSITTRTTSSPNTLSTTTSSRSTSSTTASESAPAAETSAPSSVLKSPTLSNVEIGAISAGGAIAVLLLMVAIFTCRRRKRAKARASGFYKMQDSWSPKRKDGQSPNMPQISAPVYREPKQMSYSRALAQRFSLQPDNIGLAISSENGGVPAASMPERPSTFVAAHDEPPSIPPMSPLRQQTFMLNSPDPAQSPSRPALTLTIPDEAKRNSNVANVRRMPFNGGRDSVMTEFAEDGELDPNSAGTAQIWRPPPSDPQSATTYYVADKWGNWVLGNNPNQARRSQIAELETPVDKIAAERAQEDIERATVAAAKLPRAPEAAKMRNGPRPGPSTVRLVPPENMKLSAAVTPRSSSVYSNFSLPQAVAPGPSNPVTQRQQPNPEAYYKLTRGDSMKLPKRRSGGTGRERTQTMMSQDSATTIASSAGSALDGLDDFPLSIPEHYQHQQQYQPQQPPQGSLSPVVESPRSPGTSPVSYPKIRRPQSGATSKATGAAAAVGLRIFPPEAKRDYTPPGQPSPTLGLVAPQPVQNMRPVPVLSTAQVQYASRKSSLNPIPNRNPGQVRTGSPNIPGAEQDQDQEQPLASMVSRKPSPLRLEQQSQGQGRYQDKRDSRSQLPSQARYNQGPEQQYRLQNQQQRQYHDQRYQEQQQQQQQHIASFAPPTPDFTTASPATSNASNASSLLAKRLGAERAAALAIDGSHGGSMAHNHGGKWKRQSRTVPDMRMGSDGMPGGPPTPRSAPAFYMDEHIPLPATPGWLPKLTPTRRGDDLFLNVQ